MEKKYQIFISSTYTDLIEARTKVRDAILNSMNFPVGMELFSADDKRQWSVIEKTIDSSDYYVLILGNRYGSIIDEGPDKGISYTEKEYRYASKIGIPILAFLISDDASLKKSQIELDPEANRKLSEFKNAVKANRLVEWWSTPDDLALKVNTALFKQYKNNDRPGWIRGDFKVESKPSNESRASFLEFENDRLKAMIMNNAPELSLSLKTDDWNSNICDQEPWKNSNPYYHGSLVKQEEDDLLYIKFTEPYGIKYTKKYEPIDYDSIPNYQRANISKTAVQYYNDNLPSDSVIADYENQLRLYRLTMDNGVAFKIVVSNTGSHKATDLSINMQFPDSFLIYKTLEVSDIKSPAEPVIPDNPLDLTGYKYQFSSLGALSSFNEMFASNCTHDFRNLGSDILFNEKKWRHSVEINNLEVSAYSEKLLNKDTVTFDNLYIVPTEKGRFSISYSILCSEVSNAQTGSIIIIVD